MNGKFLALGSAVAAFGASLCCLGPLVLGGFGLGAALMATFAPLRPYFLTLSGGLLALGFYFVYRKPRAAEACEDQVCAPNSRVHRWAKPVLWLATLAIAALALFPMYGAKLMQAPRPIAPATVAQLETAELNVSGMTCEACAVVVKKKLLDTPGVVKAEVDYPTGLGTVQYDLTKTDPTKLIEAVNAAGYKASLPNP